MNLPPAGNTPVIAPPPSWLQSEPSMRPLLVRAHLASGIAQAAPWGIALDGLLASQIWAATKADRRARGEPTVSLADLADPEDLPLPLARCTTAADLWHWAATCALPEPGPAGRDIDVRYWTGRLDHRAVEHTTARLPRQVSDSKGPYRARRMPLLVTPCRSVTWHAIGHPDSVRSLLDPVIAIGKKRGTGEGHVLKWEIEPAELDPWAAAHLHHDGSLGRPTPQACLPDPDGGICHGGLGTAGIRPPYIHPSRQHTVILPAFLDGDLP